MNVYTYVEDSWFWMHRRGIGIDKRTFLPFLPVYPTGQRDIFVIDANHHTPRIVKNDKNVNHFQQIITF
jgi:hypothetical protein